MSLWLLAGGYAVRITTLLNQGLPDLVQARAQRPRTKPFASTALSIPTQALIAFDQGYINFQVFDELTTTKAT